MLKEGIETLLALTERANKRGLTELAQRGDRSFAHKVEPTQYGPRLGEVLSPFRPAKLEVSTLTGFVDAINGGVCGTAKDKLVIHVEDYLTVSVKTAICDEFGVRDTLLQAKYQPVNAFKFDEYYSDPSKFIIAFQVAFHVNDPDGVYVLRLASNLTAQGSVHTADDGINQTVVIKVGEVKTGEHTLKPRVKLLPRRTFDEAAPVESEFLIRLKQTAGETPAIALFSVEGTKWQGDSMRAIRNFLADQLQDWTILA